MIRRIALLGALAMICVSFSASASADDTLMSRGHLAYLIAHSVGGFESFVPPETETFPDVPVGSCCYAEIEYVNFLGIIIGYGDGNFHPESQVSRGEMAVRTAWAAGWTCPEPVGQTFPDVPPEHWAHTHIECLVSHGIDAGYPSGLFHPAYLMHINEAADWLMVATGTYVDPVTIPPCASAWLVAAIEGKVTQRGTRKAIQEATVTCGLIDSTTTALDGMYQLQDVPPGSGYTLTATAVGYVSASVDDVSVSTDQVTVVDFALTPAPSNVLLKVHPNEQAPGAAGPNVGDPYSTAPGAVSTGGYTWKTYNFAAGANLWIQVCAQAQRASNTPSGIQDRLQMLVDGVNLPDYWADNMAAPPNYQWNGSFALDMGRRKTLRFLSMGVPGAHSLRFKAVQYPILWWIKVTDLEPGVIEPPG